MKSFTHLLVVSLVLCSHALWSQTDWKLGGNTTTTDSKLGTNNGFDLIIETSNSERLRITDGGKIGIGTDDPVAKLHVVGDFTLHGTMRLSDYVSGNGEERRYMYLDPSGEVRLLNQPEFVFEAYRYDCKQDPGGLYPSPAWKSTEGLNYGTLCTGFTCPARVGIGTNAPMSLLDVTGLTHTEQLLVGSQGDFLTANILAQFGVDELGTYRTSMLIHRTQGLQLNYAMNEATFPLNIKSFDQVESTFRLHTQGLMDLNYFGQGNELVFNAFNRVTNAQIATLTSEGVWYCQGVVVKHVPFWPDYVFSSSHKLWSLYDLESYLNTHKHLPGMPSAAEMQENGVDMTQVLTVLTEKVEELTLYTIQQQKEIDALRAELNKKSRRK